MNAAVRRLLAGLALAPTVPFLSAESGEPRRLWVVRALNGSIYGWALP